MDVVGRFQELLAMPDPPLDGALALIAANGRRDVEPGQVIRQLDSLADDQAGTDAGALTASLFGPAGLRGNVDDYYDPTNSLLDQVIERRVGIPITLSVIAIEVGRRKDLQLVGIGMPGHFLIREAGSTVSFFDPFDGGRRLDANGCRGLFQRLHGSALAFDDRYLRPTSNTAIVMRVLNNLHGALARRRDTRGLADVLRLQAALPGGAVTARRRLADVLSADGRFAEAAQVRDRLAIDDAENAESHSRVATQLRARMN